MNIDLKQFRKENDLTQVDMARQVGVSLESYRRWEQQVINPNTENEKKLKEVIESYE